MGSMTYIKLEYFAVHTWDFEEIERKKIRAQFLNSYRNFWADPNPNAVFDR